MFGAPANADDPRGLEARGDDMYYNQVLPSVKKRILPLITYHRREKESKRHRNHGIHYFLQTFSRRQIVNSLFYQVYYI